MTDRPTLTRSSTTPSGTTLTFSNGARVRTKSTTTTSGYTWLLVDVTTPAPTLADTKPRARVLRRTNVPSIAEHMRREIGRSTSVTGTTWDTYLLRRTAAGYVEATR